MQSPTIPPHVLPAFVEAIRSLSELERMCLRARARGMKLREIGELVQLDFLLVAEIIVHAVETLYRRSGLAYVPERR